MDEENEDSDSGSLCCKCRNFRDLQAERCVEAARVLAQSCPEGVAFIAGDSLLEDAVFACGELTLSVKYDPRQMPPLQYTLASEYMSRKALDAIRQAVRSAFTVSLRFYRLFEIALAISELLQEVVSEARTYRISAEQRRRQFLSQADKAQTGEHNTLYGPELDINSIHDTISDLIGIKPKAVLESIGRHLRQYEDCWFRVSRIVHCETVLRSDLSRRFMAKREELRHKLQELRLSELKKSVPYDAWRGSGRKENKEDLIEYLLKPKLTYHGTSAHAVGSIVQHGFLKPGDRHPVTGTPFPVSCGSTYGRGIYSSPSAAFALLYSGIDAAMAKPTDIFGEKLIICATIMGRSASVHRGDSWREQSKPYPNSDSHVANDQREYIVFDSAQILPCYVVHLDWGSNTAEMLKYIRQGSEMTRDNHRTTKIEQQQAAAAMAPGDRQRAKEERLARGQKFFAYGFGPVSGRNLVIEDVAESSDDEEDYGDYQKLRLQGELQEKSVWDWQLEGQTGMDQYGAERKAARIGKSLNMSSDSE